MIETYQELVTLDTYRSKVDGSISTAAIGKHELPYPTSPRANSKQTVKTKPTNKNNDPKAAVIVSRRIY